MAEPLAAAALIVGFADRISSRLNFIPLSLKTETERLEHTLQTIRGVLRDFEDWEQKSRNFEDWMGKLLEALRDADELVDDLATEALRRQVEQTNFVEKVLGFFPNLGFHFAMARRMKNMRGRIDSVASDWTRFRYTQPVFSKSWESKQLPREYVDLEHEVYGRDSDKGTIIELLMVSGDEEYVSVLPIVGMGGIGKTTLAQLVYNDESVNKHFELRMWVCLSDDFKVGVLARKIIEIATREDFSHLDLDQLQVRCREILDGKKYLLVLDDVWNEDRMKWQQLICLLRGSARGSKIIVTTRSQRVASILGPMPPYYLGCLSESDSWCLFTKLAFRPQQKHEVPHLVSIGKEIVRRCGGVPLVVRTLASLLYLRDTEMDWLSVKNTAATDTVSALKLCYDHLPYYLKQCFAYCSIFPRNYLIEKDTLVQLWMAQGYIYSPDTDHLLEDIGDRYFWDLCGRSFFQDIEKDKYGNIATCRMHDLLRDLAIMVAGDEFSTWVRETQNIEERTLHLSIDSDVCFTQEWTPLRKATKLRTLFVPSEDGPRNVSSINVICSSSSSLRVLHMLNTGIETLPSSIGQLKRLRYLDLSGSRNITKLPSSITRLRNLQTLKLSGCYSLEELPKDIGKLVSLRHLEIDGCYELTHMPRGLGQLTSLQTLPIFVLGKNSDIGGGLSELKNLNHLSGKLWIENLNNVRNDASKAVQANLKGKPNLVALGLKWEPADDGNEENDIRLLEGLQPHPNLKELWIRGYRGESFPGWMMDPLQLPNLVELTIEECFRCQHLPPFSLPTLRVLRIRGCDNLMSFSTCLTSLEYLDICLCPRLLMFSLEGLINLPSLRVLKVHNCDGLTFLPTGMQHLERLEICKCRNLDLSDDNENHMQFQDLRRLTSLRITGAPKLVSLPIGLQHVTTLQYLEIHSCDNFTTLPDWIVDITSLQFLGISKCPVLSSLPSILTFEKRRLDYYVYERSKRLP